MSCAVVHDSSQRVGAKSRKQHADSCHRLVSVMASYSLDDVCHLIVILIYMYM